jgi:hypothetical protein
MCAMPDRARGAGKRRCLARRRHLVRASPPSLGPTHNSGKHPALRNASGALPNERHTHQVIVVVVILLLAPATAAAATATPRSVVHAAGRCSAERRAWRRTRGTNRRAASGAACAALWRRACFLGRGRDGRRGRARPGLFRWRGAPGGRLPRLRGLGALWSRRVRAAGRLFVALATHRGWGRGSVVCVCVARRGGEAALLSPSLSFHTTSRWKRTSRTSTLGARHRPAPPPARPPRPAPPPRRARPPRTRPPIRPRPPRSPRRNRTHHRCHRRWCC